MQKQFVSKITLLLLSLLLFIPSLQAEALFFDNLSSSDQEKVLNSYQEELGENTITATEAASLFDELSEEDQNKILHRLSSSSAFTSLDQKNQASFQEQCSSIDPDQLLIDISGPEILSYLLIGIISVGMLIAVSPPLTLMMLVAIIKAQIIVMAILLTYFLIKEILLIKLYLQ